MRFVPTYGLYETRLRRACLEYLPSWIGNFRPIPSGLHPKFVGKSSVELGDEVSSEPVLMRALPCPRFADAFGFQVQLPDRTAERLEDFEAELRNAGFMRPDEALVKVSAPHLKFRVKKLKLPVDGLRVHEEPPVKAATPSGSVPSLTGVPSQAIEAGQLSRAESGSVPLQLTLFDAPASVKVQYYRRSRARNAPT